MSGGAVIDGRYRYSLWRNLKSSYRDGTATFIMLNPSTADAMKDDPTIRRCIGCAERLGYGWLMVVNLFAFRATNPADLKDALNCGIDSVGPKNTTYIEEAVSRSKVIVAAWGVPKWPFVKDRVRTVVEQVREIGAYQPGPDRFVALGFTKDGHPRHPLYAPYSTIMERMFREGT